MAMRSKIYTEDHVFFFWAQIDFNKSTC